MPLVKNIEKGLWEIRSNLAGERIGRIFFCMANNAMILVHGIIKKTQKVPKLELEIARKRRKKFEKANRGTI